MTVTHHQQPSPVCLPSVRHSDVLCLAHYGHSRQFRSFLAEVRGYWDLVMPADTFRNSPRTIRTGMFH